MQASELSGGTVRRPRTDTPENHRTVGRTAAGHFANILNENSALLLSGRLSGAVRPASLSAVCPVGVSIGHPTPDTRTQAQTFSLMEAPA